MDTGTSQNIAIHEDGGERGWSERSSVYGMCSFVSVGDISFVPSLEEKSEYGSGQRCDGARGEKNGPNLAPKRRSQFFRVRRVFAK